ncbi:MAG: DUF1223 domain-containing protein [Verrucomicrobiota bacterium]
MLKSGAIGILVCGLLSGVAHAKQSYQSGESRVALIELFTSQGCSSCPPAERWLAKKVNDPGLWNQFVPVAFHVNYWDYLGWKDPYASDYNTKRQVRHRNTGNLSSVYTPAVMVDSSEIRAWRSMARLPISREPVGSLSLTLDGNDVSATFDGAANANMLNVAILAVGASTKVTRGENAGRKLDGNFVVVRHMVYRSADKAWAGTLNLENLLPAERYALVGWVSQNTDPTAIQAVGGWLDLASIN